MLSKSVCLQLILAMLTLTVSIKVELLSEWNQICILIQNVAAIDCNFTFVENDSTGSESKVAQTLIANLDESQNHVFNCDQSLDGDFDFSIVNDSTVGNRFNSQESFELQEPSCITSRRFITPRALNNVYNQLVVLNSATYVQKIQITECR